MAEITKSTEAKKDEMQVEKEKLESVKKADAAVKTMHDFTSPEVLYEELINSVRKYHPSTDISMIEKAYRGCAVKLMKDQKRKSGEPYIIHPLMRGNYPGRSGDWTRRRLWPAFSMMWWKIPVMTL